LGIWSVTDSAPEIVPAWLAAHRENSAQRLPQREKRVRQGATTPKQEKRTVARLPQAKGNSYGFVEPERWPFDDCKRREAVLDTYYNPPRMVRRVGWQRCMVCGSPFFSEDVVKLRLCDGTTSCRNPKDRWINGGKPA
jgi:hypothetical protein